MLEIIDYLNIFLLLLIIGLFIYVYRRDNFRYDYNETDDCTIVMFSGNINFLSCNTINELFKEIYKKDHIYIIKMNKVKSIDTTVLKEFTYFAEKIEHNSGEVIFTGLDKKVCL